MNRGSWDLENGKIIELERQQRERCCGHWADIGKLYDIADAAE